MPIPLGAASEREFNRICVEAIVDAQRKTMRDRMTLRSRVLVSIMRTPVMREVFLSYSSDSTRASARVVRLPVFSAAGSVVLCVENGAPKEQPRWHWARY